MSRAGRTPFYPSFFDKSYPNRVLFILEGNALCSENWSAFRVYSFKELIDVLFRENGLCFVQSLADSISFPFLMEAIDFPGCEIMCTKDGHPLAIRVTRKSHSRWIVPSERWDRNIDEDFLPDMRALYHHFKIVKPTPGSLGQAVIRRSFSTQRYQQVNACNSLAYEFLTEHGVGGRCDVRHVGENFDTLLELDASSAYLARSLWLPSGTSHVFKKESRQYATYFAECEVTIHDFLPLGPFPVRVPTGRSGYRIGYPVVPGRYTAFLWKEQVEEARQAGCTVNVKGGIGWEYLSNILADAAKYLYASRVQLSDTTIERDTKKIAVSAIGHFGMGHTFYRLTRDDLPGSPNLLNDNGQPLNFFVQSCEEYDEPSMMHWFNYIIAMNALTLYKCALPFAVDDRLIMTNYDALLIVEKDERSRYARKHSLESLMCEMGDFRWQELTNVTILGERSLKCDQKVVRPGVERVQVEL